MKVILFCLILGAGVLSAQPLSFSITTASSNFSITCAHPTLVVSASSTNSNAVVYSWSGTSFTAPVTAGSVSISVAGIYSVVATSGTNTATQSFIVTTNTTIPVSTGSPSFLVTNTSSPVYTFTAISPTLNITHSIYSPVGGTFTANSPTVIYVAGGSGIYRYCMTNDENGCSTACLSATAIVPGSPGTFTGIDENTAEGSLLFPNPSDGLYTLVLKPLSVKKLEVFSSLGVLVKQQELFAGESVIIDIRNEQSGVYFIKLTGNHTKVRHLKLVKE